MREGISFESPEEAKEYARTTANSGLYPIIVNKGDRYKVLFCESMEELAQMRKKIGRKSYG